mgnify:FL=1
MKQQLEAIRKDALEKLSKISNMQELEELKVSFLGKKGELTRILKGMGALTAEERPIIGQVANDVRAALEEGIVKAKERLGKAILNEKLKSEVLDVTMPGRIQALGKKHPLTSTLDEIKDIFLGMGYEIAEGPEVELDYNNFEALNIPKNHPARDTQDTFYINDSVVLRCNPFPGVPPGGRPCGG